MPGRAPGPFASPMQGKPPVAYQPPVLPTPNAGRAATPVKPIVRLQSQDDPPPARPLPTLAMPTPEQLGLIAPAAEASRVDWVAVHRHLDGLGCSCFQIDQPPGSACRIVCLIPRPGTSQSQRIEVEAATSGQAIDLLLKRTEALVSKK